MYVCIFLLNVGAHLQKSHIPRPHDTIPIPIKITPPRTSAFPDSFVPRVLPRHNPVSHITNVTTATISEQTTAITKPYPAVVNPTDNASIDVAIPYIISTAKLNLFTSFFSSSLCTDSLIMLPPIYKSKINAIHGMNF